MGGDPQQFFAPMPAGKIAVGFLTGDTTAAIVGTIPMWSARSSTATRRGSRVCSRSEVEPQVGEPTLRRLANSP
ncbi:hypothetical protein SBA4_530032 [Candidatus Sulfopaludibacter sp. SbA4]|nr:hypothetical protein SBA4_530032 [Candidatus Sulfopaludibacter sp. SbA4]